MKDLVKVAEIAGVVIEVFKSIGEIIDKCTADSVLSKADALMFLTTEKLGFNNGILIGDFADIGQMMIKLSEIVLIVVVLCFGLRRIFEFIMYKKEEACWKFLLRMTVVGILAGCAYYLCFGAVFFAQNVTEYIRSYLGEEKSSFSVVEDKVESIEFTTDDDDGINLFDGENMIKLFAYITSVLVSFSMGIRYLLLELLILFAPIFVMFFGFQGTKNITLKWAKCLIGLLSLQVFSAVLLKIFSLQPFDGGEAEMIVLVAFFVIILMMNKVVYDFCLKKC